MVKCVQIWGRIPCLGPSKWVVWNHLNGKLHWLTGLTIQKVCNPLRFPVMKWIDRFAHRKKARPPSGNCRKLILEASTLMPTNGYVLPHGCLGVWSTYFYHPVNSSQSPNRSTPWWDVHLHIWPLALLVQMRRSSKPRRFGFATCASWCWVVLGDEERNKGWRVSMLNDEWRSKLCEVEHWPAL